MRTWHPVLAVATCLSLTCGAHADTIVTFKFENMYFANADTGTGTLTIDTTTGFATGLNFQIDNSPENEPFIWKDINFAQHSDGTAGISNLRTPPTAQSCY